METEKFKTALKVELDRLNSEMKELGVKNPGVKGDWVERTNDLDTVSADLNDVADRTEEYDERRATLATLEGRYNNIKRALKKIDEGNYGICEVSGEPIEEDRLEANPAARTCKAHMDEAL
ncbi:TraR/DksA C4-type zinc finger protein [Candidatus Nomurabacteria bacterium]|nr:TraR/DksA C4-type zinc finger protein [Candidatus Nomurabacteria bacterium]MCB9819630.1 TraR/DksA C4-type zinc finger protein [Candidatus Nomurabacteria bacterium]